MLRSFVATRAVSVRDSSLLVLGSQLFWIYITTQSAFSFRPIGAKSTQLTKIPATLAPFDLAAVVMDYPDFCVALCADALVLSRNDRDKIDVAYSNPEKPIFPAHNAAAPLAARGVMAVCGIVYKFVKGRNSSSNRGDIQEDTVRGGCKSKRCVR
jgi:hypothetical protein